MNDLKNIKFYIGPVSKNVIDTIVDFSIKENYNLGIVASRRQIDWDGGYVNNWNTKSFIDYLSDKRKNLIIERDHSGANQGKYIDNGTTSLFVDGPKFDIIHLDPWIKYNNDFNGGLEEIVNNINSITTLNQNCLFEVGTEESILYFDENMLDNMLSYLKNNLGEKFKKIVYCVIQSGTALKGTKNIGKFDKNRLIKMIDICNKYNILSKEHNGDYLNSEEIKERFKLGLSAINIAPEFGVYETEIILENITDEQKDTFFKICHESNKWCKWVDSNFDPFKNKIELIKICGHYQFSTPEFLEMNIKLDNIIKEKLYQKIKKLTNLWK